MPRRLTPSRAAPLAWTDNYARHARAHGETIRLTIHTVRTTTTFEDNQAGRARNREGPLPHPTKPSVSGRRTDHSLLIGRGPVVRRIA